ncbi:hypothetical protein FQV26_08245 [Planococcus sp. CPCC 101016]|uniref:hypothetical protein n=1 Tax=Planococcus sp. CPCC 101016 TaxID=2599617 RepID=UPI0011B7CA4E|nr:hypothetical protein [Planococcus sp. CPCC 101016]TWT07792.1 hypothetical protein FQV26_08245 [Planococcus sp. CPCC 101016]
MKKKILFLILSLFVSHQALTQLLDEKSVTTDCLRTNQAIELVLLNAEVKEKQQTLDVGSEMKFSGISVAERKTEVVKADLDEEAGRVNWGTAVIVLCVAFCVYLINRSKRQDIE